MLGYNHHLSSNFPNSAVTGNAGKSHEKLLIHTEKKWGGINFMIVDFLF